MGAGMGRAGLRKIIGHPGNGSGKEIAMVVTSEADVVAVRLQGKELAEQLGFTKWNAASIATAISEVARNMVKYARGGEILMKPLSIGERRGILITAIDQGPGIPDVDGAMRDGFSTGGGLGLGLPGARRLMDEFSIVSEEGWGTVVTMRKWLR